MKMQNVLLLNNLNKVRNYTMTTPSLKKITLTLLTVLCASTAYSKQLTVVCAKQNPSIQNGSRSALAAVIEIANINAKPVMQELVVDGARSNQGRISNFAITKDSADLYLQFGQGFYSSAKISLQDCQDSFSATGAAQYAKYVGGFAGTQLSELICTCELK